VTLVKRNHDGISRQVIIILSFSEMKTNGLKASIYSSDEKMKDREEENDS